MIYISIMKRPLQILILVLSTSLFYSCEDLMECLIFSRNPELPNKSFKVGSVNSYYYDEFDSEIDNEPQDNNYGYEYDIDGTLPIGIEAFSDFRTFYLEGIPEESGEFSFTVYLYVDPPLNYDPDTDDYDEDMCSTSTSKTYTLIINP